MKIITEENSRILIVENFELDVWAKYLKEALEVFEFNTPKKVKYILEFSLENTSFLSGLELETDWNFDEIRIITKAKK